MTIRKSKKRPPSGTRCDCTTGVECQRGHAPTLVRCAQEATVELLGAAPVGETWVCEEHAAKLLAKPEERAQP